MKNLNFVLSLTTRDNDYQMEQAACATAAALRSGIKLQVLFAENDSILQSQQLLNIIQSRPEAQPDGIIFEPVGGTALPQVARAAAAAGISWVVMNREVDYLAELRKAYRVPIFSVSSDHEEIGRIQSSQIAALLPQGGSVLYVQGPTENLASKLRTAGMHAAKPSNVQVKIIKGQWTEASAYKAVSSWLKLSTSQQTQIDAIIAQNDVMAMGAKKAFQECPPHLRDRWFDLPYTGCDGLPKTGQAWVRNGMLAATVIVPAIAGQAVDMLARAVQTGIAPPERTYTVPQSFPTLDKLAKTEPERVHAVAGRY